MSVEKNKKVEEQFNDYEATPVPEEVHMSWLSQGAVWIGCGFCLAAISTGGILANGLGFKDMILAAILGAVILTIIANSWNCRGKDAFVFFYGIKILFWNKWSKNFWINTCTFKFRMVCISSRFVWKHSSYIGKRNWRTRITTDIIYSIRSISNDVDSHCWL